MPVDDKLPLMLIRADYRVRNLLLRGVNRLLFRPARSGSPVRSILIFRTGSLGDGICALPAIDVIRRNFPGASLDILTNAGRDSYVSLAGIIRQDVAREVIDYLHTPWLQLFRRLKSRRYDLFIELTQYDAPFLRQVRNILAVKALGIHHAYGWKLSTTFLFPRVQERHLTFPNDTERLLAMLRDNGLDVSTAEYIHGLSPETIQAAEAHPTLLAVRGKPLIGLGIGGNEPRKFWETGNYAQVARYFTERGFHCLLLGGPADHARGEEILQEIQAGTNLCGALSPLESMAAIRNCRLVISNDTGTLHMAYAVGTPVIGIYTARDYVGKWYPPPSCSHAVFRTSGMPCTLCLRRGRNLTCAGNVCLQLIRAESVIAAGERLLERG